MTKEEKQKMLKAMSGKVIAVHANFMDIAGTAAAGIFLSQLFYWADKGANEWFYKTQQEWFKETRLSFRQIESARKILKQKGILEEKRCGLPAVVRYKLNTDALCEAIDQLPENYEEQSYTTVSSDEIGNKSHQNDDSIEITPAEACHRNDDYIYTVSVDNYTPKEDTNSFQTNENKEDIGTKNTHKNTQESTHKNTYNIENSQNSSKTVQPAVKQKGLNAFKLLPEKSSDILGIVSEDSKFWKAAIKSLVATFGGTEVVTAFEIWAKSNIGIINSFPISKFAKVAGMYLKNKIVPLDNRLDDLCTKLYQETDINFVGTNRNYINLLLTEYSPSEILKAFKEFIVGKDEIDLKYSAKNFCEGAAKNIILAIRKREEQKLYQEQILADHTSKSREETQRELDRIEKENQGEL